MLCTWNANRSNCEMGYNFIKILIKYVIQNIGELPTVHSIHVTHDLVLHV